MPEETKTTRPDHVLSIRIDRPVERVWEEITKIGRVQRAFFNTVLESDMVPGHRLRYYSPDRKRVFVVGETGHSLFLQTPEDDFEGARADLLGIADAFRPAGT